MVKSFKMLFYPRMQLGADGSMISTLLCRHKSKGKFLAYNSDDRVRFHNSQILFFSERQFCVSIFAFIGANCRSLSPAETVAVAASVGGRGQNMQQNSNHAKK